MGDFIPNQRNHETSSTCCAFFFVCENVNDILVYYILLYQKARMRSKLKFIGFVVHRLGMGSAINPKFDQMYLGVGLAGGEGEG